MTDHSDSERSPATWLARPTARRGCVLCGVPFVPPWPSTRYCSPECRGIAEEARRVRKQARGCGRGSE